ALARSELERGKAIAVRCGIGLLYMEAVALGARLEARRQPSPAAREADDYNEDWIAPLLVGRQSIAERAHELGIPRAVLRRAYQRYHRRLEDLRAAGPAAP
ncbi:MAG TPA: hypothetical protein VGE07_10105, partial [Herpetosiphonaceae bacterium]